LMGSPAMSARK